MHSTIGNDHATLHVLGVIAVAVGSVAALTAEGVLVSGALGGKWRITDGQRDPRFQRWLFSGLALLFVGVVLLVVG